MVEHDESIGRISEKILSLPRWVIIALRIRYYLIVKPFGLNPGKFNDFEKDSRIENLSESGVAPSKQIENIINS